MSGILISHKKKLINNPHEFKLENKIQGMKCNIVIQHLKVNK